MSICSTGLGLAAEGIAPEDLVSDAEAAEMLRVLRATLATWRAKGKGPPYVKLGRRVFYCPVDLRRFIANARREPNAA